MHNINPAVQAVPLETYGGLISLARPENVPEGASPRNYNMDYLIGNARTRDPMESVYSFGNANTGPNGASAAIDTPITGTAWTNPSHALANDGSYAVCMPGTAPVLNQPINSYTQGNLIYNPPFEGSDGLDITGFSFDLPATSTPTGFIVTVKGYATTKCAMSAQLLLNGQPVGAPRAVQMPTALTSFTLGTAADSFSAGLAYSDVNNPTFGVRLVATSSFGLASALVDYVTITVAQSNVSANFNFLHTFVDQDGSAKNVHLDADGNFWVEDATNAPGTLNLAFNGVAKNSFARGVNGPGVEYVTFNDLTAGCDLPRQYTPLWTDRISQVGPGASPVFAASSAQSTTYGITSITQPAARAYGFSYFLQSEGPGNNAAGNVVTVYYVDSTTGGPDTDLVTAFNSGNAVYLYFEFTGGPATQGPVTVLVTSVGEGTPPGQPRQFYYFTYTTTTDAYINYQGSGHSGYTAHYQRSLATMTTAVPVPQLTVGSSAVIEGSSVASYDATWPISQTLNSGAMAITQTSLTAGLATYSYAVVSGANPVAGQLVTITNTLNANGTLNVVNYAIASVSGTNIGTFTIAGFSAATNYAAEAEEGQATTAGTEFDFEPGLLTLGSSTSPIYGNATGGEIVVAGVGQYIPSGTYQGVVGFITRNGYYTAPGPPVTFSVPENTTGLNVTQLPIGPPNVSRRYIGITEAGQNGVPGANFFILPVPVEYIVENVTYTATATVINDNTSTTASLFFTGAVLDNAEGIDIQGNNLFNLIELGNPGWVQQYDTRNAYGLCQNKIQNFTNLSFDGGYNPGATLKPLGWTVADIYGQLQVSPVFGNSYYIKNTSGATLATAGLISQSAYQDAYLEPILNAQTAYSVRVTARCPSGNTTGSLVISLTAAGITYGSFTLPFASMTSSMGTYTGTLLLNEFTTVPAGLLLQVAATGIGNNADVEIDRFEPFPTAIPVLATTVFFSYADDFESVDAVTGAVQFTSENRQPVNGAVVMYDTFYGLKQGSMYSLQSSASLEPAQWNEPEVAQRAGACGVNAYDFGEQWIVEACRNGIYLFEGGQPGKIMQEIFQIWEAINWQAGKSIWVKNDVTNRRLLVGVPLPTPNFWLPDEETNAAPTQPNVILMMNYQGCETGEAIKSDMQMHTTMFGSLNAVDMRRKWSIWPIACPYAELVSKNGVVSTDAVTGAVNLLDGEIRFGNGIASSKVYRQDPNFALENPGTQPTDDGATLESLYTTYGYINTSKAAQMPLLGIFRKLWTYMTHQISGAGTLNVRLLPNVLLGPTDDDSTYYPYSMPGGFALTDPCTQIREAPLNFAATRTFVELSTTGRMDISNLVMVGRKHVHNQLTGQR